MSVQWVRRVLLINLIAQVGIVVTGGLVRITGSGLGCPVWPRCVPGSYTPVPHQAQGFHKDIEFGNRLLTSVVSLTAVATLVTIWLFAGRGRLRALAATPILLVAVQAVLGGITVLTGLSPVSVAAHFLVSMLLVTASTVLWLRFHEPLPRVDRPEVRRLGLGVAALAVVVLILGTVVTGSGPHSGDAVKPARFGFDPAAMSQLHADAVLVFVGLVVALLVALRLIGAPRGLVRRGRFLLGVTLGQGAIGYLQYATGLPGGLVVLHMLGACLLVVATTAVVQGVFSTQATAAFGELRAHEVSPAR